MAAQEYYQSFQQPQRPVAVPVQNKLSPQSQSPYGTSPRTSSGSVNSGAVAPYPTPPYPVTPGEGPQRAPYPSSDNPPQSQQYLAPPGGPAPQNGYGPLPGPQGYFPPQQQPNGYPSGPQPSNPYNYPPQAPLALQRSISEPPGDRRPSLASSYSSQTHHHHRRRDYDDDEGDDEYEGSRSRDRRPKPRRQSRSDRDTFLGAGGGAIVGDAIFPGLGTLGGLLLGGWGGHEYARRRSKSEMNGSHGHHHHHGTGNGNGGKKESYRNGITVRSEWGLIER